MAGLRVTMLKNVGWENTITATRSAAVIHELVSLPEGNVADRFKAPSNMLLQKGGEVVDARAFEGYALAVCPD